MVGFWPKRGVFGELELLLLKRLEASFLSYYFLPAPKRDEPPAVPENKELPVVLPNNPPVYFFSPLTGVEVFPKRELGVLLPKSPVGFSLFLSHSYFFS